jgi:hypothetical protein
VEGCSGIRHGFPFEQLERLILMNG